MKQSSVNLFCISMAILSGVGMFLLKYHVLDQEKELVKLKRQIVSDNRELHLLRADWAFLTDPQHLRKMIQESDLKPLLGKQIVKPDEIEERSNPLLKEKEETDV